MKIILNLLIILSLAFIPFTPFSQDTKTNTPIASVEYFDQQVPVEKKAKQKKRARKQFKHKFKHKKKQKTDNNKKGIPTLFIILGSALFVGFLAWAIYFFPLLASGGLATSWGCLAPIGIILFGFLGIFLSLVLLAGAIILILFAILMINRNNPNRIKKDSSTSNHENQPKEDDFIRIQIQDKASKDFPNLAPETLAKYVATKDSIVELKYDRSELEAMKVNGPMKSRVQSKINSINRKIAIKEALIDSIEKTHADLEPIPKDKRLAYTNIKIKIAKLKLELEKYQQRDDFRAIGKSRDIEKAIREQEEELKLLLGIGKY